MTDLQDLNKHTATAVHPAVERVGLLRQWMLERGYAALIVPTADPHGSEYLPERWKVRQWLTGFTGSAGLALVTLKSAALWTDSRYFLQAEQQLAGSPFTLMREGEDGVLPPNYWLMKEIGAEPLTVGYVGEITSLDLLESVSALNGMLHFEATESDPFDTLWLDRPALPDGAIRLQHICDAGVEVSEKMNQVRCEIGKISHNSRTFLLSDLSEIAWLLNLRGDDIQYNPYFVSYLLIEEKGATLFVDQKKLTPEASRHLSEAAVSVMPYDAWKQMLLTRKEDYDIKVYCTKAMNCGVISFCEANDVEYAFADSPIPALRAVKNEAEIAGFRRAMERDGVAMVRFLSRLDEHVAEGNFTEVNADEVLTALRAEGDRYCSLSFGTIAAYGPNGAIVHYEAEANSAAVLEARGLLLLDSGAQYEDATTDLTRTVALGRLTEEERKAYTLVLKAHISLAMGRYPEGITGLQLDTAARYQMWLEGYDFGHGTGHGVGANLGVHEGPHQIRKNMTPGTLLPFRAGMIVSNEPGIYVAGQFGVRLENLLLALPAEETPFGRFFRFETLTLCPFDLRPVYLDQLSAAEVAWLNDYHAMVCDRLLPLLNDEADKRWLIEATRKVEVRE